MNISSFGFRETCVTYPVLSYGMGPIEGSMGENDFAFLHYEHFYDFTHTMSTSGF